MVCHAFTRLASVAIFVLSVLAQTETVVDAAGETIVQVITLDSLQGLPTTEILSTITDAAGVPPVAATSSSSSAVVTPPPLITSTPTPTLQTAPTTAPDGQQGPVGAPPATTPGVGPLVYTYTTTDGSGETIAVIDTFTPSYPSTSTFAPVSTGTVLSYSQWLSIIGASNPTSGANSNNAAQAGAAPSIRLAGGHAWVSAAAACMAGLLGGAWLVAV